jgi:DNA mismatch repair protein MutS
MVSPAQRVQTPMMKQYLALKAQVPDALLFFRLGDFYELFLEDAERAAPLLDLVLTTRDRDAADPVPMCGVPVHAVEVYIRRLLDAGHRVAIGEQVEDAKLAKGLVRREIVEVISPGLVADASRLADSAANYVAAVVRDDAGFGFAYLDVSTGEFAATSTGERAVLDAELARTAPREIVVRSADKDLAGRLPLRILADADFDPAGVARRVGRLPHGFERHVEDAALRAAAALWMTAAECQRAALESVDTLRRYRASERMILDPSTRGHLELVRNARDGSLRGTLLEVLDRTRTPMGRRLLTQRIGEPLLDAAAIAQRQHEVARWLEPDSRRASLRDALRGVGDLERILTRMVLPGCGPRDLAMLRAALAATRAVHAIEPFPEAQARALADVHALLERTLVDDPPSAPRGEPHVGYIRDGVDPEVDQVRSTADQGHAYLDALEARERERTGLRTLRVRYNRVFGYSIELSRAQAERAPEEYRRKQTTANAERFTTEELLHWEGIVLRARESAAEVEARVLQRLREQALACAAELRATARAVAELDVAQALADVARSRDYVRPTLDATRRLRIEGGRHPVAETLASEGFIPNDVEMDADEARFLILTGPNMAGKSTLLRQVALIALLAQMGSWVPARAASIGIVDRIFTRVGASDSLLTGESTFMVEMRETAAILREATDRSLVLLDEIGRGTSTFDGLSIAWAVAEHLHDTPGLRARTLFATHYHELADLARTRSAVRNFHFSCAERGDDILFLRRMEPGAASRSYGIEVARKAGLPPAVIRRARQILQNLEGKELDERGQPRLARQAGRAAGEQLALFGSAPDPLREALRELDPARMTPLEALVALDRLKRRAEEET